MAAGDAVGRDATAEPPKRLWSRRTARMQRVSGASGGASLAVALLPKPEAIVVAAHHPRTRRLARQALALARAQVRAPGAQAALGRFGRRHQRPAWRHAAAPCDELESRRGAASACAVFGIKCKHAAVAEEKAIAAPADQIGVAARVKHVVV